MQRYQSRKMQATKAGCMKPYKDWRYTAVKAKAYFECGYGITQYVKYLIAFNGLASRNVKLTMALAIIYVPFCFILGWYWYNHGWITREIEVSNEFNWFVKQMRNHIRKRKI